MFIINRKARLVTFSFEGKEYKFLPAGDAVEVPDEAAKKSPFLANQLKTRSLEKVGGGKQVDLVNDDELDELREEAALLDITVDKRWGIAKLKEKIEEAQKADDE
jgi:hypothetical protein